MSISSDPSLLLFFVSACLVAASCAAAGDRPSFALDVETGNPLHLVRDVTERPVVVLTCEPTAALPEGTLLVADRKGRGPKFAVDGGSSARFPLPWPLPANGYYRVSYVTNCATAATTSFAVVDRHEVTPFRAKPKFRMGFTSHLGWYGDEVRQTMLAALVASGAKIVRCGFLSMSSVCPEEGRYDWAKADTAVGELRARGIAINGTVHPFAAWAAESNRVETCRRDKVEWAIGGLPPRPGVFREYCRKLAARYGTQIDYYEIGNEFELIPAWMLPRAEAVRLQREAWEGLKAGCPDVCVSTCGWAVGDSEDLTPLNGKRLPNDGLIEYFAEHAKPYYDIHAIHLHGPYREFPGRLKNSFLALRKRFGIRQPWFANETADHGAGGREWPVAVDVWRKILYALAMGSVDYTWYNLRAKPGSNWAGAENAYGMMTSDFHPRPSYAAFAALASLVADADFRDLDERGGRTVVRLQAPGRKIFVGWTERPDAECEIEIPAGTGGAETWDVMGNRTAVKCEGPTMRWHLTEEPSALVVRQK